MENSAQTLVAADPFVALRQRAHRLVARNPVELVEALFGRLVGIPATRPVRPSEVGLVMVRGRAGGDGQRFNLGELPVARAAIRLADPRSELGPVGIGPVGIGYVAGRDLRHAELAALADALAQSPVWREALEREVLVALEANLAERRARTSRKAAATKVDFFTMVRTRAAK